MQRTCSQCGHLTRTSPCQVFHKCEFWCDESPKAVWPYIPDEWEGTVQAYTFLHCHVQPEAPACLAFQKREAA